MCLYLNSCTLRKLPFIGHQQSSVHCPPKSPILQEESSFLIRSPWAGAIERRPSCSLRTCRSSVWPRAVRSYCLGWPARCVRCDRDGRGPRRRPGGSSVGCVRREHWTRTSRRRPDRGFARVHPSSSSPPSFRRATATPWRRDLYTWPTKTIYRIKKRNRKNGSE